MFKLVSHNHIFQAKEISSENSNHDLVNEEQPINTHSKVLQIEQKNEENSVTSFVDSDICSSEVENRTNDSEDIDKFADEKLKSPVNQI